MLVLLTVMTCIRPDISQSVNMVRKYMYNKYMYNLGKGYEQVVKWILRYSLDTVDVNLKFE